MAADGSPIGPVGPRGPGIAPSREDADGRPTPLPTSLPTRRVATSSLAPDQLDLDAALVRLNNLLADGPGPSADYVPRGYYINILV